MSSINNSPIDEISLKKLTDLKNDKAISIVEKYISLCKPAKITVITDSEEDINYVKNRSLEIGEEIALKNGHTVHYDGYHDQARDKKNTRVLLPEGKFLENHINTVDRDAGLDEMHQILEGIMQGKEMFIRFFCLGPTKSKFSISALQITDSAYVAHSEDILYRQGYEQFKNLNGSDDFFYLVHSAGKLDENKNSVDIDNRRIYIDLEENRVYSVNNQYAGNSLGLKKLCLRLAINKANKEGWLTEHMFISGVPSLDEKRKTYFLGAYPSACGKTSTAMIPGHTIVGDDITYIKLDDNNKPHAVNIENGIFGIIKDVNPEDDPLIYKVLTTPREMIYSNVLINDGKAYWQGMNAEVPDHGRNHSGEWKKGNVDSNGKEIPISHGNARYTIRLRDLENVDPEVQNPDGVEFRAILYGGRDSDTAVPVAESLYWAHGVMNGASIESETTAATLGKEGVRKNQPMANLDFVVVPLASYLDSHLKLGEKIGEEQIKIFTTNYFLRDENNSFFDDKVDKKVWLKWAEGRVHNEFDAIETPIGFIPRYEDLKDIFKKVFDKEYKFDRYEKEFAVRIDKFIDKLNRVEQFFKGSPNLPEGFTRELQLQRDRLLNTKDKYGKSIIKPSEFI